jgi:uncharacterized protein YjbI with pentapeptide repeats
MANPEHLAKLKSGADAWNSWRAREPEVIPDLTLASLLGTVLDGVSLVGVNLAQSNLFEANLASANLSGANLDGANLREAILFRANLEDAILDDANLFGAHLGGAKLTNSVLFGANFNQSILDNTDLSKAAIGTTSFGDNDLSTVIGLATVKHVSPSTIGIDTIYRSRGKIPEVFLRGAGVPETFITFMRSLTDNPIEFYSCFISYSNKDDAFAAELHTKLQAQQVRCWKDSEDLKIGDRFQEEIERAIRLHDKLLVVLSENSVNSAWVEREVQAAFEKEQRQGSTVLFPVRLDEAVMDCPRAWAANIRRTRHIGDFRKWKDHDSFQKSLDRLLRDLKSRGSKMK